MSGEIDRIIRAFRVKAAKDAQAETDAAEAVRAEMEQLMAQPGWQRLIAGLTAASDMVYHKWLEGQDVTAEEHAFAKLARRLATSPQALLEEAAAIVAAAQGVQYGR